MWFRDRSSRYTMKVISLTEAKTNLSKYANFCREEPVIVTVNGAPAFELVPIDDDDLIDQLLEHHPRFEKMLRKRLKERSIAAKEAARRL